MAKRKSRRVSKKHRKVYWGGVGETTEQASTEPAPASTISDPAEVKPPASTVSDSAQVTPPSLTGGRRRRRSSKKSKKSRKTRKTRKTRRHRKH